MSRIVKRVTPEQKKLWHNFCKSRNLTESAMLGAIIEKVTNGIVAFADEKKDSKTNIISVRFTAQQIEKINERYKRERFNTRSTWINNIICTVLDNKPTLVDDEIIALRESTRELTAIGRNLNQIARAINIEFRESDKIKKEQLDKLTKIIKEHCNLSSKLIQKTVNRWGVGNG